jgi:hypothetical protein
VDFLRLFRDFCNTNLDLRSINSSHIALIPKKSNPETVDDYRPISLLNYSSDSFGGDFPIVQYADDTLLILPAEVRILFNLKGLLRSFSDSTGLHVNFSKSFLVPINLSDAKTVYLAHTFGCAVGSMPFTYLGLPLGTTKPTLQDFSPMLTRIENRLFVVSKFLSYHGRLILVNSVMNALPTFYMCTLQLPPQIIKQIDSYRKKCLWSGGEINRKGNCLAAWEAACRPIRKEALVLLIPKLKIQLFF